MSKSRYQQEFDALPEWAKQLVNGLNNLHSHAIGWARKEDMAYNFSEYEKYNVRKLVIADDSIKSWDEGFDGLLELRTALSAPWPPPSYEEACRIAGNDSPQIVELAADPEGCAFDQPCAFGYRVETHAVYCHNAAWPHSPRKCRRNRDNFKHEDCPGFVANERQKS